MKVNIGCGDHYAEGWYNIDLHDDHFKVDDTWDITGPWPINSNFVDMVYAGHVMEHLSAFEAMVVLGQAKRVLKPGGELLVVSPDYDRVVAKYGHQTHHMTGESRWPGDEHKWVHSGLTMRDLLRAFSFDDVADLSVSMKFLKQEVGWPIVDPFAEWQYAITGIKPKETP